MSEEITVTIKSQNNLATEFTADYEGREIRIDPCVGCALPHSIFKEVNFIGKTYSFNGSWYSQDEDLFLPDEMFDPIEE